MIQAPSFAVRAMLASAAVHVSVAVVVSRGTGHGALEGNPGPKVELYTLDTSPEPALEPPPEAVVPAAHEPAAVPTNAVPAPHPPAKVARPDSVARGNPAATPGPASADGPAPPVEEAPALAATSTSPARFVLSLGASTTARGGVAASPGTGPAGLASSETFTESGVSAPARLRAGHPPDYPAMARAEGVEADVPLEIVVDAAGAVVEARALRRAGYGMDEAALAAVRSYTFSPAARDGRAVRVRMRWVVEFRIQ